MKLNMKIIELASLCIMTKGSDPHPSDEKIQALIKVLEALVITEKKDDYTYEDYIRYIKEGLYNKQKERIEY